MIDKQGKSITYNNHFLSASLSEGLGPTHLTRVTLHFEILVTFRSTETESLYKKLIKFDIYKFTNPQETYLAVITNKHGAMTRITRSWTEITTSDMHLKKGCLFFAEKKTQIVYDCSCLFVLYKKKSREWATILLDGCDRLYFSIQVHFTVIQTWIISVLLQMLIPLDFFVYLGGKLVTSQHNTMLSRGNILAHFIHYILKNWLNVANFFPLLYYIFFMKQIFSCPIWYIM